MTVRLLISILGLEKGAEEKMLEYARQRAIEALKTPNAVILASSGPAGVRASEVKYEARELMLYLLIYQIPVMSIPLIL
jgi:hypothetical protein